MTGAAAKSAPDIRTVCQLTGERAPKQSDDVMEYLIRTIAVSVCSCGDRLEIYSTPTKTAVDAEDVALLDRWVAAHRDCGGGAR
ncbi:hypothetical protein MINS_12060 [Mycolicibacterium insubricum]|uniref:Uncharacterized protein n=1 Tax=Mycolicibacterium insubricum TaxID=444597 RepID=A0A1X0CXI0_9MYCO|nr:hypothetical protein [Mycolicibacterium insubricum]ORA64884.1 hypothetical protein BST26_19445 [Mycolicibacterium insubricum]BBZ65777.1 hypothetical protein MINS_12060 [Mycolicibacterium insubricum]